MQALPWQLPTTSYPVGTNEQMEFTALTVKSRNSKTGEIAVSTTAQSSCPSDCPMAAACYAKAGYYTRTHWDKVSRGERGVAWDTFVTLVSKLPAGSMFRHNVAGDLWHDDGRINLHKLIKLAKATTHLSAAWTYTHHKLTAANRLRIEVATRIGFTVNASCESKSAAADLIKRGIPAVTVVEPDFTGTVTVDGVRIVQCPATRKGSTVTCASCGGKNGKPLCAIADRGFVIAFPAHGARAKLAEIA